MSGYFERLAHRSGLRGSTSTRARARNELASPATSIGLEQERVVEVAPPGPAPAPAPHALTSRAPTTSKARADREHMTQSQMPHRERHGEPAAPAAGSPVAGNPPSTPGRRAERPSALAGQAIVVGTTSAASSNSASGPEPWGATRVQSRGPGARLAHRERRLVSPALAAEAHAERGRDKSSLAAADTPPRVAPPERESIERDVRTQSRSPFLTGFLARSAPAPASTPPAPTAIDVRIGTVAVEVHQPAPQPASPPPPVFVPAPAPRPSARRERFSPSRHYLRVE